MKIKLVNIRKILKECLSPRKFSVCVSINDNNDEDDNGQNDNDNRV